MKVRLVDNNDYEVAQGEIGELISRTDAPWANKAPQATAVAWWNGCGMEYRRPLRNAWVRVGLRFQNDLVGSS